MFTRQVYDTQFDNIKEQFKDILREEKLIEIGD